MDCPQGLGKMKNEGEKICSMGESQGRTGLAENGKLALLPASLVDVGFWWHRCVCGRQTRDLPQNLGVTACLFSQSKALTTTVNEHVTYSNGTIHELYPPQLAFCHASNSQLYSEFSLDPCSLCCVARLPRHI